MTQSSSFSLENKDVREAIMVHRFGSKDPDAVMVIVEEAVVALFRCQHSQIGCHNFPVVRHGQSSGRPWVSHSILACAVEIVSTLF